MLGFLNFGHPLPEKLFAVWSQNRASPITLRVEYQNRSRPRTHGQRTRLTCSESYSWKNCNFLCRSRRRRAKVATEVLTSTGGTELRATQCTGEKARHFHWTCVDERLSRSKRACAVQRIPPRHEHGCAHQGRQRPCLAPSRCADTRKRTTK